MASVQNEGEEMEAGGDESDDSGVWQPPFAEVEDENGNTPFPVGTLSEISSHVKTTVSTTKKMIDFLKLDSSSVFIDVGCGVGAVSNVVAQEVQCRVLGLDFCENEIVGAQKAAKDLGVENVVSYVCADMFTLPQLIEERGYDLSKTFLYMYLIPKQIGRKELREMCEGLMKQGAKVVTFTYHPPFWSKHVKDDTYDLRVYDFAGTE
jgi:SAM-dependent methyltransferase